MGTRLELWEFVFKLVSKDINVSCEDVGMNRVTYSWWRIWSIEASFVSFIRWL